MDLSITNAEYLGNYKIVLNFSDGEKRTVDFSKFLQNAKNPMTIKYLDEKLFHNFKIIYGDIVWNDYELCFPIYDLYSGKF